MEKLKEIKKIKEIKTFVLAIQQDLLKFLSFSIVR